MFRNRDLLRLPERAMRRIRGNEIGMIFQEPMSSLNPLLTIGEQIAEVARAHRGLTRAAAWRPALDMLARVRIPDPALRAGEYPHRLSGGMRQRVMIAMALACHPSLLIADEPTTALDVTIQAQILDLMRGLQAELAMSVLFITHNLGVVAEIADRVAVMYAGRIVEQGTVSAVFARPLHPYTIALLASIPHVAGGGRDPAHRLASIPGQVPSAAALPQGCAYAPRCARATDLCRHAAPPIEQALPGHAVRCHHWRNE
jgi:peptide/nickel transport system ATP-binding protein